MGNCKRKDFNKRKSRNCVILKTRWTIRAHRKNITSGIMIYYMIYKRIKVDDVSTFIKKSRICNSRRYKIFRMNLCDVILT